MLIVLIVHFSAAPATATSCAQPDIRREADQADAVVYGRIVSTNAAFLRLEVSEVLKGRTSRTLTVFPGDYDLPSDLHTLYLRRGPFGYTTRLCGGSHSGVPNELEREILSSAAPEADEPGLGLTGNIIGIVIGSLGLLWLFTSVLKRAAPAEAAGGPQT